MVRQTPSIDDNYMSSNTIGTIKEPYATQWEPSNAISYEIGNIQKAKIAQHAAGYAP